MPSKRLRTRAVTLMDRVYEHISIPPVVIQAIDTPEFQRLRGLKQLGVSSFLYPGAVHTRFEHSIGVAHLAGQFLKNLKEKQPELGVTERDVHMVMVAGLAHDLGHGPFSHLFEDVVVQGIAARRREGRAATGQSAGDDEAERQVATFSHERMSEALMRRMLRGIFDAQEIDQIAQLMAGAVGDSGPARFAMVISNKRNGVDVDRIDYFVRDSLSAFGKPTVDVRVNRLFNSTRLFRIDNDGKANNEIGASARWELAFEEKMALTLRDLFALRAKLHKYVYQHQAVKCVGHMIGDALSLASADFKIAGKTLFECACDPDLFLRTGDWILDVIEQSDSAALADARAVLQRLRCRDLYPLVLAKELSSASSLTQAQVTDGVLAHPGGHLDARNFIAEIVRINHGCGKDDPLLRTLFFNPKRGASGSEIELTRVQPRSSPLFSPMEFEERTLLIFVRTAGKEQAVSRAVSEWLRAPDVSNNFESAIPSLNFAPRP